MISFEVRCWRWRGAGLTHREPLVDENDFERFVATVAQLLQPSRDVMWVLCGRTDSNVPKLKKILAKFLLRFEVFHFCYNTKQMQTYGYWKRQRGIANSKSLEPVLCVFRGKMPKNMPKQRKYVDANTLLFNQVVRNVPVLNPKHYAYVSREVREKSLLSMVGVPHTEDVEELAKQTRDDEDDTLAVSATAASEGPDERQKTLQAISGKKRKLYRQISGTQVPWFPHDNDIDLLKELCWEAARPRWVLHGTPAGGAGIHGCFEMGCSVVALCYDDHHRIHLQNFWVQRAVEAMASGTTLVFKEEALQKMGRRCISPAASAKLLRVSAALRSVSLLLQHDANVPVRVLEEAKGHREFRSQPDYRRSFGRAVTSPNPSGKSTGPSRPERRKTGTRSVNSATS